MEKFMEPEAIRCPNCGSEKIVVEETQEYSQDENATCSCNCGAVEDGIAAKKESINHNRECRWGWLEENPDSTEWAESETVERETVNFTIYCEECHEHSSHGDWDYEKSETDPDDIELDRRIYCRDCEHELDLPLEDSE
jgi:hypothetical protein